MPTHFDPYVWLREAAHTDNQSGYVGSCCNGCRWNIPQASPSHLRLSGALAARRLAEDNQRFGVEYHEGHVLTLLKKLIPHERPAASPPRRKSGRAAGQHGGGDAWQDTKPASARRMASTGKAQGGAQGRDSHPTSTTRAPTCSALSVRRGKGAALALPHADTPAMQLHTMTRSAAVPPRAPMPFFFSPLALITRLRHL